jgi:NAD(P)-dependent dehydrogenase (short-subunit alcohol dehydrogenase family)
MSQRVLVTGSNSGFGRLTVETLASEGHTVFATMRDTNTRNANAARDLRDWANQQGFNVRVIELDVTRDESVRSAIAEAVELDQGIDVVVNNAGVVAMGLSETFTMEQIQHVFNVNVFGPLRVIREVLPHMRKQGSGLLIQISSCSGRVALPFVGIYTSTKFATEGFAESYRYDLASLGIDSVIIEPGMYPTEIFSKMIQPADSDRIAAYGELAQGLQQMAEESPQPSESETAPNPQDVADAVLKLMNTPYGQRPLRTVVDPVTAQFVESINECAERNTQAMLQAFGG